MEMNFTKPSGTDNYNIGTQNDNWDKAQTGFRQVAPGIVAESEKGTMVTVNDSSANPMYATLHGKIEQTFEVEITPTQMDSDVLISLIPWNKGDVIVLTLNTPRKVECMVKGEDGIIIGVSHPDDDETKQVWNYTNSDGTLGIQFYVEDATVDDVVSVQHLPSPTNNVPIYGAGQSRNEFDMSSAIIGKSWSGADDATRACVFVPVEPNTAYCLTPNSLGLVSGVGIYEKEDTTMDTNYVVGYLDVKNGANITTASNTKYLLVQFLTAESKMTSGILNDCKYQIEKGTKATPYKAFGAHSISAKSTGKNLCATEKIENVHRFANIPIDNLTNGNTYTLSCVITSTDVDSTVCGTYKVGEKEIYLTRFERNKRVSVSFVKNEDDTKIRVYASDGYNASGEDYLTITDIQIEEGAVATPYEPYTETKANIPLSSPLYEGDYIRYNMDGTGEESHKMKAVVFDGSESGWLKSNLANINVYYIAIPNAKYAEADDNKGEVEGSCTHFNMVESYLQSAQTAGVGSCGFGVVSALHQTMIGFNTDFATLEEWTAWLAENKPKVVYELAEEEVTPLTAEQIAELKKLWSFYHVTHATIDDGEISIAYIADTKKYIDNKFAEFQNLLASE